MSEFEFEYIEEYEVLGEKRFRLRIKGTNIVLNVGAHSMDEAIRKANELVRELEIDKFVKILRQKGEVST